MKCVFILVSFVAVGHCASLDFGEQFTKFGDLIKNGFKEIKKGKEVKVERSVRGGPVVVHQGSHADTGFGGTALAHGAATAINRGSGGAFASQESSASSRGPGVSVADGSATAVSGGGGQRPLRRFRALDIPAKAPTLKGGLLKTPELAEKPLKLSRPTRAVNKTLETPANKTGRALETPAKITTTLDAATNKTGRLLESPLKDIKTFDAQTQTNKTGRAVEAPLKASENKTMESPKPKTSRAAEPTPKGNLTDLPKPKAIELSNPAVLDSAKILLPPIPTNLRKTRAVDTQLEQTDSRAGHEREPHRRHHHHHDDNKGGITIANSNTQSQATDGSLSAAKSKTKADGTGNDKRAIEDMSFPMEAGRKRRASGDSFNDLVSHAVNQAVRTAENDPNATILSSTTKIDSSSGKPTKTILSIFSKQPKPNSA